MTQNANVAPKKTRQKVKIWARLSIPILLVVVLQVLTYSLVLVFGGEFRNIREYAYNTLVEKTVNRTAYIRNELRGKPILVQEYSEEIDKMVTDILEERGASILDLQTDKDLNRTIIESSVGIIANLLRSSLANDAYLILETGDLYSEEAGDNAKAALYLRDLDTNSGSGYSDLLLELGFSSISQEYNITRDPVWSAFFIPDPQDTENFDFYFKTIRTAQEKGNLPKNNLGYWCGFTRLSSVSAPSMKYSLPLIAQDGTVYGVIGVGLLESTVLSNVPADDFQGETACYVLGHSKDAGKSFEILTRAGSAAETLLGKAETLYVGERSEYNADIYDFDMNTDAKLLGSVQIWGLYNRSSAYSEERWALISVADRSSVLQPVTFLSQMLVLSALASLAVAGVIAIVSCTGFIRPITSAIKLMKTKRRFNEVIHFKPSNIYEIDEMTDAITQLQIDVQNVSSEVSKMISIADVGLGTFRYDRTDDSVFVGQSLIKVLRLDFPHSGDIMMSRHEFLDSIKNKDVWSAIAEGLGMTEGGIRKDYSEVYPINQKDGSISWIRVGYTYSSNTAVCIVQDITDAMLEKQRIEYERDFDSLTGLLNRHAYYRRIEKLFRDNNELNIASFIMIDLDNLKYVNDTYGHDFGDDYIRAAAGALKEFEDYGGIVARISGDEFNVCLYGFSSKDELREIINRVRTAMLQSSCLMADGTRFRIRASFGVSWYPDDSDSYEMLMKYADFAMYTVKHSTKGELSEFDMNAYSEDSVLLTGVEEMNRIIEESSVKYAFQSIVSAKTGEIYGYEALMRVQSSMFQSPLELLRAAKTSAKLYEIERLTWIKSLSDFRALIDAGHIDKTAHVFINSIATCELESSDVQSIEAIYSDLMPKVVLEILEDENANETFTSHKKDILKSYNAQIALDDFGTGYNSEYALLSIQPNIVKIDRSIISGCDKDASRRMIIKNLVNLARTKDILVLAEGIETEDEMKTSINCGVDLLQGYYIDRPLFVPHPIDPDIASKIRRLAGPHGASESSD